MGARNYSKILTQTYIGASRRRTWELCLISVFLDSRYQKNFFPSFLSLSVHFNFSQKSRALLRMRTAKITSYNKDSIVETNQAEIVKSQVK